MHREAHRTNHNRGRYARHRGDASGLECSMNKPKPYVRLVTDSGNGESQLTRMFDNAEEALSYLSGYIGTYPITILEFDLDWSWK